MRADRRRVLLGIATGLLLGLPAAAGAQQNTWAIEQPMLDPWVPPQVVEKATVKPVETSGEALRLQVRAKLKRRFEAAAGPGGDVSLFFLLQHG